jgi:hypothetical protein
VRYISGGRNTIGFSLFRDPVENMVSRFKYGGPGKSRGTNFFPDWLEKRSTAWNPQSCYLTQRLNPTKDSVDSCLREIDHVGITEEWDEFVYGARKLTEYDLTFDCKKNSSVGEMVDRTPEHMRKYCGLDMYLYNEVLKRLGKVN